MAGCPACFATASRTSLDDRSPRFCPGEKLDMLRPRERDEDAHAGFRATIEKPARRQMIDPCHVDPQLAHLREVTPRLLCGAKIIAGRVRLEWSVGGALDKKLAVALEEELGERTDANRRSLTHEELFLVQRAKGRKGFARLRPNEKPAPAPRARCAPSARSAPVRARSRGSRFQTARAQSKRPRRGSD